MINLHTKAELAPKIALLFVLILNIFSLSIKSRPEWLIFLLVICSVVSTVIAFYFWQVKLQQTKNTQDKFNANELIVHNLPDLVWLKSIDGVYLSCSHNFALFFGKNETDIIGKNANEFMQPEYISHFLDFDRPTLTKSVIHSGQSKISIAETGYTGILETYSTPLFDAAGKLTAVLGIAKDITDRHKTEQELKIAAIALETHEGIVITDANRVILQVNRAFSLITGYKAEEIIGKKPSVLKSNRHDRAFYSAMWDCIICNGSWQGEIWNRRKNGEEYPEWINITAVKNQKGIICHYVGIIKDISSRQPTAKDMAQFDFYDYKTELPNRRLLLERLHHALPDAARNQRKVALLFIDLDNFKVLNETSSHKLGDFLLIEVARRLSKCLSADATISRLGGDEFVVILENLSMNNSDSYAQVQKIGEKLLSSLNKPYIIEGREYHCTPSIGVTFFSDPEQTVEDLLKQADMAMFMAKSAGRNTLRIFDPDMQAAITERAELENDLRLSIQQNELVLLYQPQAQTGKGILGAEALIRWRHPRRGLVPPKQFITIAEETGLILPIGLWVLETACTQLSLWSKQSNLQHLHLSINVSARQFRQNYFVEQVTQAIKKSKAPADHLKLELTETMVLDNVEESIAKMQALRQLGVKFSIDDFGTGYSSLSYLTRLPLDQLKIDQSFIQNLPHNSNDAVVVQTIIKLAHSLGLNVIAEGVETEEQCQFLNQSGCPNYQGYYLSQPLVLSGFELFALNYNVPHKFERSFLTSKQIIRDPISFEDD